MEVVAVIVILVCLVLLFLLCGECLWEDHWEKIFGSLAVSLESFL